MMKAFLFFIFALHSLFAMSQQRPRMVGHRGAGLHAPENTLSALRLGLASGMDCLEVDVHQTFDSIVVLSHDETLDRCSSGQGRIDATSFSEIRKLDAGAWFSDQFKNEQVPTLLEALELIDGKATLFIEIKGTGKDYAGLEKRVVEQIQAQNAHAWVEVISFNSDALRRVHELDTNIRLQQLLVSNLRGLPFYIDKGLHWGSPKKLDFIDGFSYFHRFIGRGLVRKIHRWGKDINAWTVVNGKQMARLRRIGVDAITTDHPQILKDAMETR